MCIPPNDNNTETYFSEMQKLNNLLGLKELSMGMSADYKQAIKFDSSSHVQEMIASKKTLAGVITFTKENLGIQMPLPIIRSKTLGEIIRNPSLKKPLWENIKKDIIK